MTPLTILLCTGGMFLLGAALFVAAALAMSGRISRDEERRNQF